MLALHKLRCWAAFKHESVLDLYYHTKDYPTVHAKMRYVLLDVDWIYMDVRDVWSVSISLHYNHYRCFLCIKQFTDIAINDVYSIHQSICRDTIFTQRLVLPQVTVRFFFWSLAIKVDAQIVNQTLLTLGSLPVGLHYFSSNRTWSRCEVGKTEVYFVSPTCFVYFVYAIHILYLYAFAANFYESCV